MALSAPFLAVIIPAYNEEVRMLPTLVRINEYMQTQPYSWCVVVVSDGSDDQTETHVSDFSRGHSEFSLIANRPNRGKGSAVRNGMLQVEGEWLLFSDADLAAPIEEIEKLLPHLTQATPIAIGSRPLKESKLEIRQPFYREWAGRSFNFLVQLLGIRGIKDTQCGFKVFRADVARDVFSRCKIDGFGFDFEALMVAKDLGYGIAEVPIRWAHQEGSKVRLLRDGTRMILELIKLRLAGKRRRLERRAD